MALKLHTVITSTRPGRNGATIGEWFHEAAKPASRHLDPLIGEGLMVAVSASRDVIAGCGCFTGMTRR